jgi:molybdenum cofactor biosynthesis protein B
MTRIDESLPFLPVRIAIITVSDTRTPDDDASGDRLQEMITADGHQVVSREILTDDHEIIAGRLREFADDPGVDVVITTGGTGVTGRDVTPEAFKQVMDKEVEGFGELFRWLSFEKVGTSTMQSRAIGGVVGDTYIFALPGSPSACKDGWMGILRFQLDSRHRPCNLVELMPRLQEHLKA